MLEPVEIQEREPYIMTAERPADFVGPLPYLLSGLVGGS